MINGVLKGSVTLTRLSDTVNEVVSIVPAEREAHTRSSTTDAHDSPIAIMRSRTAIAFAFAFATLVVSAAYQMTASLWPWRHPDCMVSPSWDHALTRFSAVAAMFQCSCLGSESGR